MCLYYTVLPKFTKNTDSQLEEHRNATRTYPNSLQYSPQEMHTIQYWPWLASLPQPTTEITWSTELLASEMIPDSQFRNDKASMPQAMGPRW